MKSSAEKTSTTTSTPAAQAAEKPFFEKAGGGDFFKPGGDKAPPVQAKMTVNKPGDKFEQEADKMADKVMRMPDPAPGKEEKIQRAPEEKVQRAPDEKIQKREDDRVMKMEEKQVQKAEEKVQKAEVKEEKVQKKEEDKVQRKGGGDGSSSAVGAGTQSAIQNSAGGGQPLSSDVRSYMEPRMGADFSNVRVHNDPESASLNNQLGARAFTYQNNVFFGQGQYQPGTGEGKQLLAHELTHTIQQGHAPETTVQRSSVPGIQRQPAPAGAVPVSSGVVDITGNTFSPSAKIKEEIEAQGDKGLEVRVIIKGLTGEGRVKVRMDSQKTYDSLSKGSMPLLNEWTKQLGGMYLNFTIKNSQITGGYAAMKPGGGDTNDWLASVKKNAAVLGGVGLKVEKLPAPVNKYEGGKLTLGVTGLSVEIGGFLSSQVNLTLENLNKPVIEATAKIDVKGLAQGELKLDNTQGALAGEVTLTVNLKSFTGTGNVKYKPDGTVDIGGKAGYASDRLSGEIQFVATDLETANKFGKDAIAAAGGKENVANAGPPGPVPAPKTSSKKRALAASGQLAFNLTKWFAGAVTVVVDGNGHVTVIGKIAPPAEIILFQQKDWEKQLIKFEAKAYYGIPLVGNLNLFANIGLYALAKLGPAKIYNIEILGTYSTDPTVQKNIQIAGSINISAYAGLRLRAEGGAGIELIGHELKFGIGLNADIGVKAYADARPTIGFREPGEFYISGTLEMVAQPMLGLGGDFFIQLDSPWWSPAPDKTWKWPLFSKEWPLTDPIGLSATVKDYVLGSGKVPDVEMKQPEFDPSKFMTSMVDDKLPAKSGKGGDGKGAFKEDGSVPKQEVTDKKKTGAKTDTGAKGSKGKTTAGGKSGKEDSKAAADKDVNKSLQASLDGLKNKQPYTRAELDKALDAIKAKAPGANLKVTEQKEKFTVLPGDGAKKNKTGAIELTKRKKGDASPDEVKKALAALDEVTTTYAAKGASKEEMTTVVKSVRRKFKFKSIEVVEKDGFWYFDYEINPEGEKKGPKADGITKISVQRSTFNVTTKWTLAELIPGAHKSMVTGQSPRLKKQLDRRHVISSQNMAEHYNSVLNGKKWSEARKILTPKIEVKDPLGNKNIQKSAQTLHKKFFNDVKNLFIGDASTNRSIGAETDIPDDWTTREWNKHLKYIKANYALDNTFSP